MANILKLTPKTVTQRQLDGLVAIRNAVNPVITDSRPDGKDVSVDGKAWKTLALVGKVFEQGMD
jgi:hypothetical protein